MRKFRVENGQVICNEITAASKMRNLGVDIYCGSDINIKGYKHDMDTDDTFIKLEFFNAIANKYVTVEIERNKIGSGKFADVVSAKGGSIMNSKLMKEFLLEKEQKLLSDSVFKATVSKSIFQGIFEKHQIPCTCEKEEKVIANPPEDTFNLKDSCRDNIDVYSRIGWDTLSDGKMIFKASSCHGFEGKTEYVGKLKIQPNGSYEKIREMFEKYVWSSVELQTIAAAAASATVMNYMAEELGIVLSNIIISLVGGTTMGKSTAMELAASFGGCPIIGERNTMNMSFVITANKILENMGDNKGFPRGIDDTSSADDLLKSQMRSLLFALANGSDKERMNKKGSAEFNTTIFITGNNSLRTYVNDFSALTVRVLEFRDVKWIECAGDAEDIATTVRQNYGHITPMIAEKLLDYTRSNTEIQLKERYSKWRKSFVLDAQKKGVYIEYTERIVAKLSLIMLSLELLGEIMEHDVDKKGVYEFLFQHILITAAEDANVGERAYHAIIDYWKENTSEFMVSSKPFVTYTDEDKKVGEIRLRKHRGVVAPTKKTTTINGKNYKRVICMTCNQVDIILAKVGLKDGRKAMREVDKLGLLMKHNPKEDNPIGFYISGGENMTGYKILLEESDSTMIFDTMEEDIK